MAKGSKSSLELEGSSFSFAGQLQLPAAFLHFTCRSLASFLKIALASYPVAFTLSNLRHLAVQLSSHEDHRPDRRRPPRGRDPPCRALPAEHPMRARERHGLPHGLPRLEALPWRGEAPTQAQGARTGARTGAGTRARTGASRASSRARPRSPRPVWRGQ